MYSQDNRARYALALHGGAGVILREKMSAEKEDLYRSVLSQALGAGETTLKAGGTALDATVATVQVMEESEHFNAGKGAVFTNEGRIEHDAAVMVGSDMSAGAVAAITNVRSPIAAAKAVMEASGHVLLMGKGAEDFAASQDLEIVEQSYFHTDKRWQQLEQARAAGKETSMDHSDHKYGTVGAVALDADGNLAAATSTGGMTNKAWGRVGDSPVIGAGTYADNNTCAVSTTGHGEYFMRFTVARDIAALMEFKGLSLQEAGKAIIEERLLAKGGDGGAIAVDRFGNVSLPFNSPGMYRGSVVAEGTPYIGIFKD